MRIRLCVSLSTIAFLLSGSALAQISAPVNAFARLPDLEHVRMSPDGTKLAWIGDHEGQRVLSIYDLVAKRNARHIAQGEEYKLRSLMWADDDTVLLTIEYTSVIRTGTIVRESIDFSRVIAFDPAEGKGRVLLMTKPSTSGVTGSDIVRVSTDRSKTIFMSSLDLTANRYGAITVEPIFREGRKDSRIAHALFEVSTTTGEGKKIEGGTPFTMSWFVNGHGKPVARTEWNRGKAEFRILARRGNGGWESIYESDSHIDLQPVSLSTDELALIAIGMHGGDRKHAWLVPLDGRKLEPFYESEEEIESIVTDSYTGAPTGFRLGGLTRKIQWLDPKLKQIQQAIERSFVNRQIDIVDVTRDYRRVLARVEEGDFPPAYYLVDVNGRSADMVGAAYPELADFPLGHRRAISYKTRDGLSIPAFLTTPPSIEAKSLPLIVLADSEPFESPNAGFDWRAQFLATRG